jgi:hypothetical protein
MHLKMNNLASQIHKPSLRPHPHTAPALIPIPPLIPPLPPGLPPRLRLLHLNITIRIPRIHCPHHRASNNRAPPQRLPHRGNPTPRLLRNIPIPIHLSNTNNIWQLPQTQAYALIYHHDRQLHNQCHPQQNRQVARRRAESAVTSKHP